MKLNLLRTIFAALGLLVVLFAGMTAYAQDGDKSPQAGAASKTAKFETVLKTDELYKNAIDAHDLASAKKLIDKDGAFKGKVAKVFTMRDGVVLILNFDRDYKMALTAVLRKADFSTFPDMEAIIPAT